MPEWGLTRKQRESKPWGLPSNLLRPKKKITDPVHGDIFLTALEVAFLDTAPMQRLRRVRQLGTTQLVYPSATHTRFSHALGTLRAVQNLLDIVLTQGEGRHVIDDLFDEWQSTLDPETLDMRIAEATVLARLGGLLHDLGHIPFGHTLEDDLRLFPSHDKSNSRYELLWTQLTAELKSQGIFSESEEDMPKELFDQLKPLIVSKADEQTSSENGGHEQRYPFVADLVGNTICADLIDYLQRDHLFAGLPAAFGYRFLDGFYVTRSDHPYQKQRMVIRISRDSHVRADIVSELFKYLRYRYELGERALEHHAKLSADVMIGKLMSNWQSALENDPGLSKEEAKKEIERQALLRSDDGILEYVLDQALYYKRKDEWQGVHAIVERLQSRKLFKTAGVYSKRAMAKDLYKRFGNPRDRVAAEQEAAREAGVEAWTVALWVPNPDMRLKPAEVLVDDGTHIEIVPLRAWDWENGRRGSEIIESHQRLWAIRAFADRSLSLDERERVLDSFRRQLGIAQWDRQDGVDGRLSNEELLRLWMEGERGEATHPMLEQICCNDNEAVVTFDGQEFVLEDEGELARLNLKLFLNDIDTRVLTVPGDRERLSDLIDSSPLEFEAAMLRESGEGGASLRTSDRQGLTSSATRAFELAATKFLENDSTRRLM